MVKIAVIGNINMDMVSFVDRFPVEGESRFVSDIKYFPGGKGANQAVAASRLGARVFMVGRVGDDAFAPSVLSNLRRNGVDTTFVKKTAGASTGLAQVTLREDGANRILSYRGANGLVTGHDIEDAKDAVIAADILMLQMGIPVHTVEYVIEMAAKRGKKVFLDPTPIENKLPRGLEKVSVISPNEVELATITGESGIPEGIQKLERMGIGSYAIKAGPAGCFVSDGSGSRHVGGFNAVNVKDTTGAGDTFSAAFAVKLAEGASMTEAAVFANAAGALSTTNVGAQEAMPTRDELELFLNTAAA